MRPSFSIAKYRWQDHKQSSNPNKGAEKLFDDLQFGISNGTETYCTHFRDSISDLRDISAGEHLWREILDGRRAPG